MNEAGTERPGAWAGLRRALPVRPGEGAAVLWAFVYLFALIGSFYVLRPIREEMGIRGGVNQLQWMFSATFAIMLAAIPAYSALVARVPRSRAVPVVYAVFGACLLAFSLVFRADAWRVEAARAFFVWMSVYNLFVVAVFWSLMADLFTSEQGKRLFGLVAGGGSAGALAGSAVTGSLVGVIGIANLVLAALGLLALAAFCSRRLSAWARREGRGVAVGAGREDPLGGSPWSGFTTVVRSPYLIGAAALMFLFTLGSTFLYFQQARIVAAAIPESAKRTALFAAVDFAVNCGALALQSLATGRIAMAFGLLPALSVVPIVTTAGFVSLAIAPTLVTIAVVISLRRIVEYALQRPARDVLFTVVSRDEKYKAKGFVDTVVYRGGDALSSWLFTLLTGLGLSTRELSLSAVPLAALSLGVGVWLARQHAARERPEAERAAVKGAAAEVVS